MKINTLNILRTAVITLGLILCAIGIYRDELNEIMRKAIIICLECVGIG